MRRQVSLPAAEPADSPTARVMPDSQLPSSKLRCREHRAPSGGCAAGCEGRRTGAAATRRLAWDKAGPQRSLAATHAFAVLIWPVNQRNVRWVMRSRARAARR